MVARDAIFLIGLATESFIAELAMAAHRVTIKEKRATVQHKDIGMWPTQHLVSLLMNL